MKSVLSVPNTHKAFAIISKNDFTSKLNFSDQENHNVIQIGYLFQK